MSRCKLLTSFITGPDTAFDSRRARGGGRSSLTCEAFFCSISGVGGGELYSFPLTSFHFASSSNLSISSCFLLAFENLAMLTHQSVFPLWVNICNDGLPKRPFRESVDLPYHDLVVLFKACALVIGSDVLQAAFV